MSDWTITEMRKRQALGTSRDSLRNVFKFPQQCFALKRTDRLLEDQVRTSADADDLIDIRATLEMRELAAALWRVPQPHELEATMEGLERDAAEMVARLRLEVATWEEEMVAAVSTFDRTEISLLRGRADQPIPASTMEKVIGLLLHTTRDFMVRNQGRGKSRPIKVADAMSMFAFRYSLCVLIYTLGWVRTGSQRDRPVDDRVNDVIDLQLATVGTFFNGVLSLDKKLREVSTAARRLLRLWGAYVGEDWQPVTPPEPRV